MSKTDSELREPILGLLNQVFATTTDLKREVVELAALAFDFGSFPVFTTTNTSKRL